MSEVKEIVAIPQETALDVFTKEGALQPYLDQIKQAVSGQVPDLTTKKGRDAIASLAYRVSQSKTYLEGVGKKLADEQKEIPKKIDASRRLVRETLDSLRDEIRKPLTQWEQQQAEIQATIDMLTNACNLQPGRTADQIAQVIEYVEQRELTAELLSDRLAEAEQAKAASLDSLRVQHAERQQYEADQAELEELRRMKAEQQAAREAEERERQAELDRQNAPAVPDEIEDEAPAEQYAVQQPEIEPEPDSDVQVEQRRADAQRAALARTNRQALDSLMAAVPGLSEEHGKAVIAAIARGQVANVTITY